MQNVNFFTWIRDGVKQSVLLGVSDAIDTIGAPDDRSELHPDVAALLGDRSTSTGAAVQRRVASGSSTAGRKRLGRSLKDIETT